MDPSFQQGGQPTQAAEPKETPQPPPGSSQPGGGARPTELMKMHNWRLIQWETGPVILEKTTFNPKENKPVYQKVNLNDVGDAVLITALLRQYFHLE